MLGELKDSEEDFYNFFENAPLAYHSLDKNGNILYANKAWCEFFGYSKEEVLHKWFGDFLTPQSREIFKIKFPELKITEEISDIEYEVVKFNGEIAIISVDGKVIRDKNGNFQRTHCIFREITLQKKMERDLLESQEKYLFLSNHYQMLLESITDAVYALNRDWEYILVNKNAENILNMPVEYLLGHTIFEVFPGIEKTSFFKTYESVMNKGKTKRVTEPFIHPDCRRGFYEVSVYPIDEGILCIAKDITEEKEIVQKLEESLKTTQTLIEDLPLGIHMYQLKEDGKLYFVKSNLAADKLLQVDNSQYIGKTIEEAFPNIAETEMSTKLHEIAEKGGYWRNEEIVYEDENVKGVFENYNFQPYPGYAISLFNDITERKKAEKKLKESEENFRTITEQSHLAITILQDDRVVYTNQKMADMFGYDREEMLTWSPKEYAKTIAEDSLKFVMEQARKKQIGDPDVILQYPIHCMKNSGEKFWVDNISTTIMYKGRPADLVTIIDTTEKRKAEQKIKESEKRFKYIISSSPAILYTSKPSGDYGATFISENVKQLWGYEPEEFIKNSNFWIDHIHPDDVEYVNSVLLKLFEKEHLIYDYRFKFKDGTYHWMRDEVKVMRDDSGNPIETIGSVIDITERKKIENALRYKDFIIDSTSSIIATCDLDGIMNYVNPAFFKAWGYENINEIYGNHFKEFWEVESILDEVMDNLMNKGWWFGETKAKKKDGTFFDVRVSANIVHDHKGNPIGLMSSSTDITARKKAEEQIRYQAQLVENVFDAIISTDIDFNIISWNKAAESMYGWKAEEVIGRNITDTISIEYLYHEQEDVLKEFSENGLWKGEVIQSRKNGKKINIYASVSLVKNDQGEPIGAVSVNKDITELKERQEAIIFERQKAELYLNLVGVILIALDRNGIITLLNKKGYELLEYEEGELLGKNWFDTCLPLRDRERVYDYFRRLMNDEIEIIPSYENSILTKTGEEKLVSWSTVIFRNEEGHITGLLSSGEDITARRKAEKELQKTQHKFEGIVSSIPDLIFILDKNFNIVFSNQAAKEFYGRSLEGYKCYKAFHDLDEICQNCHVLKTFQDGKIHYRECERVGIEEKRLDCTCLSSVAAFDENGNPLLVLEISRDMTDFFKTQKELEKSENMLKNLINNISDVLVQVDYEGELSYISPQIINITGYEPEEVVGKNVLNFVHPDDRSNLQELIRSLKLTRESFSIDFRTVHRRGFYIPVSLTGNLVSTGDKLTIIGVLRDMTEIKRVEAMMKMEVRQLKELEQIRIDLINRISHELNTPLSSIMTGSDLILSLYKNKLSNEILEIVDLINLGGYRLKDIVDNLLITYKIDSNELKVNKKITNIIPLLKLCIENIINQAERRGIFLNAELPDKLFIECDEKLINKVIINLLSNAIKNTPSKGNVFLKTFNHQNYLDVIFEDTGVGFTIGELEQLFKKFGKIERFGKQMDVDVEGPGLGLYISNEIVKLHKGEIIVKSKGRNKGSKFIMRLFKN